MYIPACSLEDPFHFESDYIRHLPLRAREWDRVEVKPAQAGDEYTLFVFSFFLMHDMSTNRKAAETTCNFHAAIAANGRLGQSKLLEGRCLEC